MNRFLGLPEIASEHGARLDQVNSLIHWMMFALFIAWGALFVWLVYRFRARRNPSANYHGLQTHASSWVEGGVALFEVVLLIGFSIPLYSERVDDLPPRDEATVVRVVGQQFAWNIHYPGPDGIFGAGDPSLVDEESNPLGLDSSDPAGKDDVTTINQLHLPVNKPALVELSTKDVIHSFFIPEMRVKQDAMPGMQFPVWFVPTVTTAEMKEKKGDPEFSYEIGCAQLCGLGHYRMRGFVTIHSQEDYDSWMAERQEELAGGGDEDDFWS